EHAVVPGDLLGTFAEELEDELAGVQRVAHGQLVVDERDVGGAAQVRHVERAEHVEHVVGDDQVDEEPGAVRQEQQYSRLRVAAFDVSYAHVLVSSEGDVV